ncbi:MAG: DNA polymerase III subunit delta' [Anaerolineae bacterium]
MNNWAIIGHRWVVRKLKLALERGTLPHALLITGPESVGKETLALTLAQAMLCTAPAVADRPCRSCSACRRVDSRNHPDLRVVAPQEEGGTVKIDQIRDLQRALNLTPNESRCKIGVLTDFERATHSAANALLKTLEEPPSYAHLILLATSSDQLLPTIVSRTQHLPLHPLSRRVVTEGLVNMYQIPPERAQRLARLSGGRVGWAIQALEDPLHAQQIEESVRRLFRLLESDLPTRFEVAEGLAEDDVKAHQTLEQWRTAWRDVLLLQTQNGEALTLREQRTALESIAGQVALPSTLDALQRIGATQQALRRHGNSRLHLEALVLNLPFVEGLSNK